MFSRLSSFPLLIHFEPRRATLLTSHPTARERQKHLGSALAVALGSHQR